MSGIRYAKIDEQNRLESDVTMGGDKTSIRSVNALLATVSAADGPGDYGIKVDGAMSYVGVPIGVLSYTGPTTAGTTPGINDTVFTATEDGYYQVSLGADFGSVGNAVGEGVVLRMVPSVTPYSKKTQGTLMIAPQNIIYSSANNIFFLEAGETLTIYASYLCTGTLAQLSVELNIRKVGVLPL